MPQQHMSKIFQGSCKHPPPPPPSCLMYGPYWHVSFHSPVSHFANFTLSPSLCYSLEIRNNGMREKKIFCIYGCISDIISQEVENRIFRQNCIFRHTCIYKQPILTKQYCVWGGGGSCRCPVTQCLPTCAGTLYLASSSALSIST